MIQFVVLVVVVLILPGCSPTTPLAREVTIGTDAYAVFVGDGRGAGSDLYAVPGRGGRAIQLTYSPVDEMAPSLAPNGGALAFVRQVPNGTRSVWVLNLISGAERRIEPPDSVGIPVRIGWSSDGGALYIKTEAGGTWRAHAPPHDADPRPVRADDPDADSSLSVLLGSPIFARIEACTVDGTPGADDAPALCAVSGDGSAPLARGASSAARWGGDSVAYLVGEDLFVRPLGGGRVRLLDIEAAPARPRELTAFGGMR